MFEMQNSIQQFFRAFHTRYFVIFQHIIVLYVSLIQDGENIKKVQHGFIIRILTPLINHQRFTFGGGFTVGINKLMVSCSCCQLDDILKVIRKGSEILLFGLHRIYNDSIAHFRLLTLRFVRPQILRCVLTAVASVSLQM
jgi:hypothetical protein